MEKVVIEREVLAVSFEGYQNSVKTGACAGCGQMAEQIAVFYRCGLRPGSGLHFNLCSECFDACCDEKGTIELRLPFEHVQIHNARLYPCGKCPGCSRPIVWVRRRDVSPDAEDGIACCHAHQPPSQRAQERLEARQDRKCEYCGTTFTPKNSLGTTCSGKCRVALCRRNKKEEVARKIRRSKAGKK
jgi:hypothetical protein